MSHYSDAEDSIMELDNTDVVLRKRRPIGWDFETDSIASEIKDLLDEDDNSLVS